MTSTYIIFENTEEDKYREMLYDLIDEYNEYDSIYAYISYQELTAISKELHLDIDLSRYKNTDSIKIGYYLSGWASEPFADRSDAVVISIPESNCYGYIGEGNTIIDVLPAKYLYEYITKNYTYSGGMLRRNAA